jgi:hypothetical protein
MTCRHTRENPSCLGCFPLPHTLRIAGNQPNVQNLKPEDLAALRPVQLLALQEGYRLQLQALAERPRGTPSPRPLLLIGWSGPASKPDQ